MSQAKKILGLVALIGLAVVGVLDIVEIVPAIGDYFDSGIMGIILVIVQLLASVAIVVLGVLGVLKLLKVVGVENHKHIGAQLGVYGDEILIFTVVVWLWACISARQFTITFELVLLVVLALVAGTAGTMAWKAAKAGKGKKAAIMNCIAGACLLVLSVKTLIDGGLGTLGLIAEIALIAGAGCAVAFSVMDLLEKKAE